MKLIKIKNEYIIVDDSEIEKGDFKFCLDDKEITKYLSRKSIESDTLCENCKKITYSTEPLEDIVTENSFKTYGFISKQEIEELLFGYSVEKMADDKYPSDINDFTDTDCDKKEIVRIAFCNGFNAHKELVKDKLFTMEDMKKLFATTLQNAPSTESHTRMISDEMYRNFVMDKLFSELIKPMIPKTEWDVQFINGKLTLKQ